MGEGSTSDQLEQDLWDAQDRGRWLSDEEQRSADLQRKQQELAQEQRRDRRRRLMVLTGVCILLPPFWPLALVLSFYLLFPATVARIGIAAGVVAVGAALATVALLVVAATFLIGLLG